MTSGNAQILDHIVVTPELVSGARLAYVHIDADFPLTAYNDATTPARVSDHDPALGYFALPAPVLSGTISPSSGNFGSVSTALTSNGQVFTFTNTGEGPVTVTGVTTTGDFAVSNNCTTVAINSTCTANVVFKPTAVGTRTGTVTFATNIASATFTGTLTGVGLDAGLCDRRCLRQHQHDGNGGCGQCSLHTAGATPINGFSGTVSVACTAAATVLATAPCVVTPTVTVGAGAATIQRWYRTTSRVLSGGFVLPTGASRTSLMIFAALAGLAMLLASRSRRLAGSGRVGKLLSLLLLAVLGSACLGLMGCGNKSNVNPNGTAAGTYTYTVTATSGTLTHVEAITLTVQ